MSDCPHGMPSPGSCVECMEDGPVVKPSSWKKIGGPFAASYPGLCLCEGAIEPGEIIQRWDYGDEKSAYLHEECRP